VTLLKSIKRSFWRGLAALLPTLLTIIVIYFAISVIYDNLGKYVNQAIMLVISWAAAVPHKTVEEWYARYWLGWLGVVASIVGLCVAAYFLGTFIGNRVVRILDHWLARLPILRRIYPGAKQVSEFFFAERDVEFRRVVAIEYPRRGLWSIGFVTGRSFRALSKQTEQELLTVFVPNSPTPITGYAVSVPRRDVIDLPITVDEAFQYVISGGMIMPPAERLESLEVILLVKGAAKAAAAEDSEDEGSAPPPARDPKDEPPPAAE